MEAIDLTEEVGAKAVIYLQSLIGLTESEDSAKRLWGKMSEDQKEYTVWLSKALSGTLQEEKS